MSKINILFFNKTTNGVYYFRTSRPAIKLQELYPDTFNIDIKSEFDWDDDEKIKKYQIIHFHTTLTDYDKMPDLLTKIKKMGIITIMDIDDYWELPATHPLHTKYTALKINKSIKESLISVDHVTTTTPVFAGLIKKLNKNVTILPNGLDSDEPQWKYGKTSSSFTRVGWLGGSQHLHDMGLLENSFNRISSDSSLSKKMQVQLFGFDLRGKINIIRIKEEFGKVLRAAGMFTPKIIKKIEEANFDLRRVPEIPPIMANDYQNISETITRPIMPKETPWYQYERILTNNYKLISDKDYVEHLHLFNLNKTYPDQEETQPYIRNKTQPISKYGEGYRKIDISLAPLRFFGKNENSVDNIYQSVKSPLKLIESGFHKTPVICSNLPAYNHDKNFKDGYNVFFVDPKRQEKDWYKLIKRLINNPEQISDMGEALYETVTEHYNLNKITNTRAELYETLIKY